jgi:hypothetical protein
MQAMNSLVSIEVSAGKIITGLRINYETQDWNQDVSGISFAVNNKLAGL